jgi:crotonobetainyl-CoA:carnitine CoA-transferase CaiB-like acyl-CoA transferase
MAEYIPGPMLTRKLCDLGAEVVKIERPGGDPFRKFPPIKDGRSMLYESLNRGKRSMVLDLSREPEKERFQQLCDVADVIVDGYRVGALEKLGINWGDLRARRPEVVICSISGFGQNGPLATLPAHGLNMDCLSANVGVVGEDGDYRYSSARPWTIRVAPIAGALATTAAAFHAKLTRQGVWLDVSCWDVGVEAGHASEIYWMLSGVPHHGTTQRHAPMHSIYRTSDGGFVSLVATEEKFWVNFFRGVGWDDLVAQFQLRQYADDTVLPGDDELRAKLTNLFLTATKSEWNQRFIDWGVAGSLILTLEEVVEHPHFAARKLVSTDSETGLPRIADPVRFVDWDVRPGQTALPAPEIGADTEMVLSQWLSR